MWMIQCLSNGRNMKLSHSTSTKKPQLSDSGIGHCWAIYIILLTIVHFKAQNTLCRGWDPFWWWCWFILNIYQAASGIVTFQFCRTGFLQFHSNVPNHPLVVPHWVYSSSAESGKGKNPDLKFKCIFGMLQSRNLTQALHACPPSPPTKLNLCKEITYYRYSSALNLFNMDIPI